MRFGVFVVFALLEQVLAGAQPGPAPGRSPSQAAMDAVTYHNDNGRTGQNLNETILTPFNVNATTFGLLGLIPVDGPVYAQPLYLSSVAIPGMGTHDVAYVATEHDSVYAFDAATGQTLWQVSVLGAGETPSDDGGCGDAVTPEIGITATPVIDRTAGPQGAMYLTATSMDGDGNYFQRLHALDITTGAELFGGPTTIQASYPGTGDNSDGENVIFDPAQYFERSGLLLLNGVVYTAWTSHCDYEPYTGWVMGFDASTLEMTRVLNVTPNGSQGAIWMSGAGLAADEAGNIYFLDGNGTFDTTLDDNGFPSQGDYGNGFIKLSTFDGLSVADYFVMWNVDELNAHDVDVGSGGALVLPDLTDDSGETRHLAVGAGKDWNIYVVDRDSMGGYDSSGNYIYQELDGALENGVFSMPAYFNHTVYYGPVEGSILAFDLTDARLSPTPSSQTDTSFGYPGATPSISANGATNGILWAVEFNQDAAGALHAYDALDLSNELYNSDEADSGRDNLGPVNKFITPTVANGRVYVGTTNGLAVFGLLQ
jgi:outer membrane protein assembly factor BamB